MKRLDRLDKTVFGIVLILLAAIALLVLRGDRIGVTVSRSTPGPAAAQISVRTPIQLVFSEAMNIDSLQNRVDISPPLSGTVRGSGTAVAFLPAQPLQADTAYTLTVRAGGISQRGRAMTQDFTLHFQTRQMRVAYLTPSEERANLVVHNPQNDVVLKLTDEKYGVYDFAVGPDGTHAIASITRDESGARDLWRVALDGSSRERLLACDEQVCQTATWSADGTRIAYERRALIQRTLGKLPGPARIWLLDVETKETVPLFEDSQKIAALPLWSPVDERVIFFDSADGALRVVDINTQESTLLPSNLGDPGAWSPDGTQLIYPDITPQDDRGFNQLMRVDFAGKVITTVFPISTNNDASVAWSPVSNTIAFSRQEAGTRGSIGAQVWTANLDGGQQQRITQDLDFSHFRLAYRPDGRVILAQRFELAQPFAKPEAVLIDVTNGQTRILAQNASQPAWVP